jgi:hypothetical protein
MPATENEGSYHFGNSPLGIDLSEVKCLKRQIEERSELNKKPYWAIWLDSAPVTKRRRKQDIGINCIIAQYYHE